MIKIKTIMIIVCNINGCIVYVYSIRLYVSVCSFWKIRFIDCYYLKEGIFLVLFCRYKYYY
ncbi:hypothetical protein BDC45DRAFT_492536, partial [Circinella umbellata]